MRDRKNHFPFPRWQRNNFQNTIVLHQNCHIASHNVIEDLVIEIITCMLYLSSHYLGVHVRFDVLYLTSWLFRSFNYVMFKVRYLEIYFESVIALSAIKKGDEVQGVNIFSVSFMLGATCSKKPSTPQSIF